MTDATDVDDELPSSTTRFGCYSADRIEDTAHYSNAMRCLSDADSALSGEYTMVGTAASQVRGAAKRLNRLADSLEAEHRADTSVDLPDMDWSKFDFSKGDFVLVDCSEGQGSQGVITGIVETARWSDGKIIVEVTDFGHEDSPQGRTYDCAPEQVTVVFEGQQS